MQTEHRRQQNQNRGNLLILNFINIKIEKFALKKFEV